MCFAYFFVNLLEQWGCHPVRCRGFSAPEPTPIHTWINFSFDGAFVSAGQFPLSRGFSHLWHWSLPQSHFFINLVNQFDYSFFPPRLALFEILVFVHGSHDPPHPPPTLLLAHRPTHQSPRSRDLAPTIFELVLLYRSSSCVLASFEGGSFSPRLQFMEVCCVFRSKTPRVNLPTFMDLSLANRFFFLSFITIFNLLFHYLFSLVFTFGFGEGDATSPYLNYFLFTRFLNPEDTHT